MPVAWRTFITLALTKPTVITAVAQEDWITAVTAVPSSMPRRGVPERRKSTGAKLFPERRFRLSPISPMPKMNSATPPISATMFSKLMESPHKGVRGLRPHEQHSKARVKSATRKS